MGLFGGSSKSSSKTSYTDNSSNLSVDLSSGDLGGSDNNIVSQGNVNIDNRVTGITENLAKQIFGVMSDTFNSSLNWVERAIGKTNEQTQQTLGYVQNSITKSNQALTQSLETAYNSEQATISSMKTYAFYGLLAFVAWAYFGRKYK